MSAIQTTYKKIRKLWKKKVTIGSTVYIMMLVVVFVGVGTVLICMLYRKETTHASALIASAGKHIHLPDETPTVATVADPAKLHDQAFFKDAQVGDKIFIYTTAAEVVLYRPSTDSVIAVAPIAR